MFAPLAPTYDRYASLLSYGQDPRWRRFLVSRIEAGPGDRVLDVATGTGAVALELRRQKGCTVVGVDQSAEMLAEAARRAGGEIELVEASAQSLPFDDGEFDGLTFTYLLRYVDDPPAVLRELARVVRPGGTIAGLEFGLPTRSVARPLGAARPRRLARGGCGDRQRVARGRVVSRPLDPRLLRGVAARPAARSLERLGDRRRLGTPALARWRGGDMGSEEVRPAFYALRAGGWRDYVTVVHLPYTAWNLAYVALGATLAPVFSTNRMLWTMAAFLLALGISAHALDELHGRPLGTAIPSRMLVGLAVAALAGASAIGIWAASNWGWGLLAFVAVGAFLVPAYNLEWFGGVFHNQWGLALAWGAFPVLTAYYAQAVTLKADVVLAAGYRNRDDHRPARPLDPGAACPPHARLARGRRAHGANPAHPPVGEHPPGRRARHGAPNLVP